MPRRPQIFFALLSLTIPLQGCSSNSKEEAKQSAPQGIDAQPSAKPSVKPVATTAPCIVNSALRDEDDEEANFSLSDPSKDEVDAVVQAKCASCHTGGQRMKLQSYADVLANSDAVIARVKDGSMPPPPGSLSAADLLKLQAWIGSQSSGASPTASPSGSASSSPQPCGTASAQPPSGDGPSPQALLDGLVNSAARKECNARSKAYYHKAVADHPNGYCEEDVSYPATFACTNEGVSTAFGNSLEIKAALSLAEGQHYELAECGSKAGKPVVYMLCYTNGAEDKVCRAKDQITGEKPSVMAKRLSM